MPHMTNIIILVTLSALLVSETGQLFFLVAFKFIDQNSSLCSLFFFHVRTFFICILTVVCDNLFYLQRIPSSCAATNLSTVANNSVSNNCFIFDWNQITTLTTNYTTYMDSNTNITYYAQIGALTVLGQIDNYDLYYECPPVGYNGLALGCYTLPNTQLVILHINVLDSKLYAIDIILSGAPFPSPQSLMENQPPFGKARHVFNPGVTIQSTGYFQICKINSSDQCSNTNLDAHKLPHPLPSTYGYGIFGTQSANLVTTSTWIMDDPNQLLIITAGLTYFYFNGTGFFMYDGSSETCIWLSACNYQCEVYNYDSRFLDYAGEWVITNKWGFSQIESVVVEAWIGNAIDAAGIFPVILYTDKETGHYLGLDKLDTIVSRTMGATYWYTIHGDTIPRTSIENFHPNVVEASCNTTLSAWLGIQNNSEITVRFDNIRLLVIFLFLYTFHI